MKALHRVTEGEFVRVLETNSITKLIAQESTEKPLKFVVLAINKHNHVAYAMRHGRTDSLRTWRLDNLAAFLKRHRITNFEVQYQDKVFRERH